MPNPTHITVTAPEGRVSPVHRNDGMEPGGAQLHVEHGFVCRVSYSQDVRRAIARGDLIPCDMDGAVVDLDKAGAPDELKDGPKVNIAKRRAALATNASADPKVTK